MKLYSQGADSLVHFLVSPTRGHHVLKAAVSKGVSLLSYTRAFQIAAVSEAEGLFLDMP